MAFARLLIAMLAWGALAFGSVMPWGYWPLAVVAAGLGLWGIVETRALEDPRTRRLAIVLAVLVLMVSVSLVPLPPWVVTNMSPGMPVFLSGSRVGFVSAAYLPLSIAPLSTVTALLLLIAFGMLLLGLVRMLRQLPLDWFMTQLLGLGVCLALFGIIQRVLIPYSGPNSIYGLLPHIPRATPFGPFVNRSNFAAWMVMVLSVMLGYSVGLLKRGASPQTLTLNHWLRWLPTVHANRFMLVAVATFTMAMSMVLTQSRSGMGALVVSLGVFGVFVYRRQRSRHIRLAAVGYLSLFVVGAVAWTGLDLGISRFQSAGIDMGGRMVAWRHAVEIFKDFPWFGTGLGTFRDAMLVYQTDRSAGIFSRAHNDYLQLLAEGGLFLAVPVLALLVVIVLGIKRRFDVAEDDQVTYWVRVGAVAGIAGICAQSIMEFGLQIPGVTVMFVLLLAFAMHRPARRSSSGHAHRI